MIFKYQTGLWGLNLQSAIFRNILLKIVNLLSLFLSIQTSISYANAPNFSNSSSTKINQS